MSLPHPLRVLYVLNAAGGGATQGILELLKGLPHHRYTAYLAVPEPPDARQRHLFAELAAETRVLPMAWWNLKSEGTRSHRVYQWVSGLWRTTGYTRPVFALMRYIREQKIDLVYTTTALTLDGALAARACRRPHLWHIKEWIGQRARVHFPLPDALLARTFTGLADRVLTMSRFVGDIFRQHHLTDRLVQVNDGVDLAMFSGELQGQALRRQLGLGADEILIGMAASLSATWKQHGLFIAMAAQLAHRLPHLRFAAFGPEPTRHVNPVYNQPWCYFQRLKQQVEELGLGERFKWAGFQPNIPQLMDAIDILVHPCDIEPFGRVAIEAMAAGRPVVGPQRGGLAESVIDEVTGFLVPPNDVDALALAVKRLALNPDLRQRMGLAGREHVAAHFSLEQHVAQITRLYQALAPGRVEGDA